jgi:hypothetical protein
MASAGRNQPWSWISPPSMRTLWVVAGAAKNQVANRFGVDGGGVQ